MEIKIEDISRFQKEYLENVKNKEIEEKIRKEGVRKANLNEKLSEELNLKKVKNDLMKEAYNFLSKVMGNPPVNFSYHGEILTPIAFKEKYIKCDLEDYVTVTYYDKKTLLAMHIRQLYILMKKKKSCFLV